MAPGRRKGASKAAAAAAARRQWKVGDLVLAKVKGFPAWPATVSEPEKWGYSSDWKKVLVYFFGTQQIAFCNHADVEPFTEEKKQVLLGKRQGKGADFVRAVQEIIESYEKLKKQEQADDSNSGDVVTLANGVNSNDSSGSKDRADTSESKADIKNSNVIASGNDPSLPTEDTSAAAKIDDLPDKEIIPVQPAEEVLVKEKPTLTTYSSRKRSRGSRSEKTVTKQKAPSIQRNRNSSRLESSRFQNSMMPCKDGGKNVGIISSKVTEDGSSRKNKRIRKKTDISQLGDGDSSVSVSNGCSEDHGSEIATVDSDNNSFNEGSTVDSGSNREHLVSGAGCLEGDVELSKSLDFQMKSLVKKKRKPNRKRVTNDSAEPLAGRDVEADLLVEMHYNRQTSQNSGDNLDLQYSKEDGDEHLPLVKRARVRMGKISSADNTSCVARAEENPSTGVAVTSSKQISPSSNFHDGSPAERNFLVAKGDLVNGSPSRVDTQVSGEIPQSWKVSKNQYSCPADGEAALPPSKRLHRALEAMSENAAEEGIACDEPSATLKTPADNGCGTSMQAGCQMDAEEMEARSLDVHGIDLLENAASGFVSRSDPTVLEDPVKSRIEADTGNQLASPENKNPEFCNNDVRNTPDCSGGGNNIESLVDSCTDHHVAQNINSDPLSPNVGVDQAFINGSSNQQLLSKDDNNGESADLNNVESVNPYDRPRTSDHIKMSPDPVGLRSDRTSEVPPHDCADVPQHATESTLCMNNESLKSHVDESSIANSMDEVMEDVQHKESLKDRSSSLISNDHLGDKDAMDIQLSPPSTDGVESMARVSPPNTSNGHISTFESSNVVQENGCCSPSVRTHHEKTACAATTFGERKKESATSDRPRSLNKCNNNAEVHNDLSSFEKQLGTLTRAKESILRATRTAIDCAKFGVSAKVVEILAHHLETETNLKKRIDLFFLVDSITQCSRGLKGDGGIYPSAIQAELPRLLAAAAPAGSIAHDNRRQCLKVLRVWLERKILPESLIRDHIRDIHSLSSRSARTERAFDDPVREMEGMLMDEYGSNSSLQLPGFCMPCMRKDDEESDSDGEGFEAVTPEHYSGSPEEREANSAVEKHRHILEDVDGELEMEDVAPSEIEMSSTCNGTQDQPVKHYEMPIAPPLPQDMPPSSPPPPPSSPPPHPPPPPPSVLPPPCLMSGSYNGVDPNYYNGQDDLRQPVAAPPVPPRVDSKLCSPAVPYQAPPDSRDIHVRNHVSNCNGSYNSYPAHPVSNMQPVDGPSFHHQAYPPHPPYHGPPDQFSYGHGDPHMKAQREPPPCSYSNRYDYAPNGDCRHFYSSHDRMKPPPYDRRESWNGHGHGHGPNFNGPRYPDRVKASHGPNSYGHPPCEPPRYPNQGWGYPPREMDHRNSFSRRPPPEDAVGSRGPGMWWPR